MSAAMEVSSSATRTVGGGACSSPIDKVPTPRSRGRYARGRRHAVPHLVQLRCSRGHRDRSPPQGHSVDNSSMQIELAKTARPGRLLPAGGICWTWSRMQVRWLPSCQLCVDHLARARYPTLPGKIRDWKRPPVCLLGNLQDSDQLDVVGTRTRNYPFGPVSELMSLLPDRNGFDVLMCGLRPAAAWSRRDSSESSEESS
jgi:hypothetical protein